MFCIQCEQTITTPTSKGCHYSQGMCGKTAEVSDLQDVLIAALQAVSFWAVLARQSQYVDRQIDRWSFQAFFATLTNVNFDPDRIIHYIHQASRYKRHLKQICTQRAAQQQRPPTTALLCSSNRLSGR